MQKPIGERAIKITINKEEILRDLEEIREERMRGQNVWVMGQITPDNHLEWEFMGVFTSEEKAVQACTLDTHFVGPAVMNQRRPDDTHAWPGAYYPLVVKE